MSWAGATVVNRKVTTKAILAAQSPVEWLRLADMYIMRSSQAPGEFALPAEHAVLSPVIESFRNDPDAFPLYILEIRDQLQPGDRRRDVNLLYRITRDRILQQSRRLRLGRALEVVDVICGRRLEPDERERVARNLEQYWAQRRREYLKAARSKTSTGRLSSDERAEQVRAFWEMVDGEITRGEVNGWDGELDHLDEILKHQPVWL